MIGLPGFGMPYRIDISYPPDNILDDVLEQLVQMGALDIEEVGGRLAAIIPDSVTVDAVSRVLGMPGVMVSATVSRDNGSVWLLNARAVRIGSLLIAPADTDAPHGALRLTDSAAFGTGHHPTTALCVEAIEEALAIEVPESILDVGTGSGVLALAAMMMGVPRAVGLDIDANALKTAEKNARLNNLADRMQFVLGGPDVVNGVWRLVVANVLAAPLIEMAPVLVRHVASRGRLILSGIPWSVESEVREAYLHLGMRHIRSETRAGWAVTVVQASW